MNCGIPEGPKVFTTTSTSPSLTAKKCKNPWVPTPTDSYSSRQNSTNTWTSSSPPSRVLPNFGRNSSETTPINRFCNKKPPSCKKKIRRSGKTTTSWSTSFTSPVRSSTPSPSTTSDSSSTSRINSPTAWSISQSPSLPSRRKDRNWQNSRKGWDSTPTTHRPPSAWSQPTPKVSGRYRSPTTPSTWPSTRNAGEPWTYRSW